MKLSTTWLVVTLCFCAQVVATAQGRFQYAEAEADSILLEFNDAIKEFHPFAYRGNGAEQLDSVLASTRSKLPNLIVEDSIHVADLIELISTFNKVIGDGHLQLTRKREENFSKLNKLYDYDFYTRLLENDKVILSDTLILLDSTTFYPGTEVLTFQGEPAALIYKKLGAFIGLDDHGIASAKTYFPAIDPASFYQRLYGWKDSLLVDLRVDDKKYRSILLPRQRVAYLNRDTTQKKAVPKARKRSIGGKKKANIKEMNRLIRLDTTSQKDVYKLQVRTFSSGAFGKANQYKHVNKIIKRLDSLEAKGLIIDLRNNTGGSLNLVNHLYSKIATTDFYSGDQGIGYSPRAQGKNFFNKIGNTIFGTVRKKEDYYIKKNMVSKNKAEKAKNRFNGEVVVLVNETTFSGGTVFANYVKIQNRGKIVGQTAGGSAERMYAGSLFKQPIGPEGSLLINMPLWYMDMPGDNIGNVAPDVLVSRSREAVIAQKDVTLEAALKEFSFSK